MDSFLVWVLIIANLAVGIFVLGIIFTVVLGLVVGLKWMGSMIEEWDHEDQELPEGLTPAQLQVMVKEDTDRKARTMTRFQEEMDEYHQRNS